MNRIDDDLLALVDEGLKERYSGRLKEFGYDPRTLGWDTRENQNARFRVAADSVDMANCSVLDVGCGLADFHAYLKNNSINISSYSGMDINPDLISACKVMDSDASEFTVRNLLVDPPNPNSYDIVSMFGVLNFRFTEFDNEDFAKEMIAQAYSVAAKAVVVDMLSARVDKEYPKESFVYYYEPIKMLDYALSLTPHVQLRHDYASIPQREFMLVLRKHP